MIASEDQMKPEPPYVEYLAKACTLYEDPAVSNLALYAFSLGVLQGQKQGERFGSEMIASLRAEGFFK